jgi:protein SMG6
MNSQVGRNNTKLLRNLVSPSVTPSLRTIPVKYNIAVRLWTYGLPKALDSLQHASLQLPTALEHVQDFIYYAYAFCTGLLEEPTLNLQVLMLEALGEMAQ